MRKTPDEIKREVIIRWLNGDSYRQIWEDLGVSTASISRFIDELRKEAPDIDQLRKLNIRLKKAGFSVYDGLRACVLMESLNNYGISLSELQDYINLSKRSLSHKGLQDDVLTYAVRLVQLEQKYGKKYEAVIEDFKKLDADTEATKTQNADLKRKNRLLKNEAKEKAERNRQLEAEHATISKKLKQIKTTYKQLQDFGPEKLQKLANFVHDIDAQDFSIEEIQKLATLKKELTSLHIDSDSLRKDALRIVRLSSQANNFEDKTNELARTHTALFAAQRILQTNMVDIPCKNCQGPMSMPLPTKQQYNDAVSRDGFIPIACPHCGSNQTLTMPEIAVQVAWTLLS